jgi:1,4-alpha-glucan branching enzyme
MKRSILVLAMVSVAAGAFAQPFFVRGDFNGWTNSNDPMIDMGGGKWSYTVSGLTAGQLYEFKATVDDWSQNAPGSNAKAMANASGQIVVNLFPSLTWSDGWMPDNKWRLGYEDPGMHGWELVGGFNGWSGGDSLMNLGNGVYQITKNLDPGTYEFKFRMTGSWDISIGDDFGNSAANNSITATGLPVIFTLDLPNGRWSAEPVPEPATLAALGLGVAAVLRRRKKA